MRNYIKRTLAVLAAATIILAFAGCADEFFVDDDQTTITINNIPAEYNGKYAAGGLANPDSANKKSNDMAYTIAAETILNGKVTLYMYKDVKGSHKPASVSSSALVLLLINDNQTLTGTNKEEKYIVRPVKPGPNSINYGELHDVTPKS
jgi:hypothetical protein